MTAAELRQHRERLGLTQYEMARALGCSQPRVEALERGRWGRAKHVDPDRPVPDNVARAALAMRPARQPILRATEEEVRIRSAVERRECPFCGRGPWRSLGRHTAGVHGVGARELREMAGLPLHARLTSDELSAQMAGARRATLAAQAGDAGREAARKRRGQKMPHSRGGRLSRAAANRKRSEP